MFLSFLLIFVNGVLLPCVLDYLCVLDFVSEKLFI